MQGHPVAPAGTSLTPRELSCIQTARKESESLPATIYISKQGRLVEFLGDTLPPTLISGPRGKFEVYDQFL